ncbi:MAG TPA: Holliday junction branch migration protein RuvA [Candidatus Pacebacteria bacterium]|nr:Holliday junction branch migration protein RuvA [Candidatus Paceibacterota bacterium]
MLSYLIGQPQLLRDRLLIINQGVGYGVFVGAKLLATACQQSEIALYLHTYVREDRLELYGFATLAELELFEQVLSVSGVGPKMALALVDAGASALITAIQQADLSFFTTVPRVGKKLGQKIIIELKSKLGGLGELNLGPISAKHQDILAALISLGFTESTTQAVLRQIDVETLTLEQAIKQALKLASKIN